MRNVLGPGGAHALLEIAHDHPLLVFDFDGTLAPIVERPDDARLAPSTRTLLRLAALLFPCAVVSGRRRADVLARLDGIPLVAVVGNHGAEAGYGPVDRSPRAQVVAWLGALRDGLGEAPGVELEDKGLSIAAHYRRAPERSRARDAILRIASRLPGVRVFGGKAVVNVVPDGAHDKGDAVARLLRRIGRRAAVYVGDDATDEDAFGNATVALGVRVGRTHRSAAEWYVPSQPHVDELLRALVRTRCRLDGHAETIEGLERCVEERLAGARAGVVRTVASGREGGPGR